MSQTKIRKYVKDEPTSSAAAAQIDVECGRPQVPLVAIVEYSHTVLTLIPSGILQLTQLQERHKVIRD